MALLQWIWKHTYTQKDKHKSNRTKHACRNTKHVWIKHRTGQPKTRSGLTLELDIAAQPQAGQHVGCPKLTLRRIRDHPRLFFVSSLQRQVHGSLAVCCCVLSNWYHQSWGTGVSSRARQGTIQTTTTKERKAWEKSKEAGQRQSSPGAWTKRSFSDFRFVSLKHG